MNSDIAEIHRDAIEIFINNLNDVQDTDNIADPVDIDPVPIGHEILSAGGSTISPAVIAQGNQLKYWFFTWNNYPCNAIEMLSRVFQPICKQYVFQKEVGANGTAHIQGTIALNKKMRWTEFKLPNSIHWEKVRNLHAAFEYCQKEDTRDGDTIWIWPDIPQLRLITELRTWQQQIVDLTRTRPDTRTVNWVYDPHGNTGKTAFAKYMFAKYDAIICTGGGTRDIACLITILRDAGRDLNKDTVFIFNLARTTEGISYKGIEAVKDGLMTSQKYETSTLVFNCPHVWVLSNQLPERSKLSADRWKVWHVVGDTLTDMDAVKDITLTEFLHREITNVNGFEPFSPEEFDALNKII